MTMNQTRKPTRAFHSKLAQYFLTQDSVDCMFELPYYNQETKMYEGTKIIGAHRIILTASCPMFDKIFHEDLNEVEKKSVFRITDVSFDDFKWFLWVMYNHRVISMEHSKTVYPSRLFKLGQKFGCEIVMEAAKKEIRCHLHSHPEMSLLYYGLGKQLKSDEIEQFSAGIIKSHTYMILNSRPFLKTCPQIIADMYEFKQMNISSENQLVTALESYLIAKPHIHKWHPDIKRAIKAIRWILLSEAELYRTKLLEDGEKMAVMYYRTNEDESIRMRYPYLSFERHQRMLPIAQ